MDIEAKLDPMRFPSGTLADSSPIPEGPSTPQEGLQGAFALPGKDLRFPDFWGYETPEKTSLSNFVPATNDFGPNTGVFQGITGKVDWLNPDMLYEPIPKDDRKRVTEPVLPYTRVVQIYGDRPKLGFGPVGTGAIIGPRHVLTAAHVLVSSQLGIPNPKVFVSNIQVYRLGNDNPVKAAQRFINPYFLAEIPWNVWNLATALRFCHEDYAVIVTETDLVGPNDTVFNFNYPPDINWLVGRQISTAGIPEKYSPCRDNEPIANDPNFNGWPFAHCDTWMYRQTAKVKGPASEWAIYLNHDVQTGQSGSPLWIYSGGVYTIYGVICLRTAFGDNLAHKISPESYSYILDVIAKTT